MSKKSAIGHRHVLCQYLGSASKSHVAVLQMEEERRKREPLSETQQIQQRRNDAVLRNAEAMLLEEKDEVKNMNQIIMYGKCVTIRCALRDIQSAASRGRLNLVRMHAAFGYMTGDHREDRHILSSGLEG